MSRKKHHTDEAMADVLVTIADDYRDALPAVSSRLRSAGLTEEDRFEFSGVIAGKAALDDLAKLRQVEGVATVECEPVFWAT